MQALLAKQQQHMEAHKRRLREAAEMARADAAPLEVRRQAVQASFHRQSAPESAYGPRHENRKAVPNDLADAQARRRRPVRSLSNWREDEVLVGLHVEGDDDAQEQEQQQRQEQERQERLRERRRRRAAETRKQEQEEERRREAARQDKLMRQHASAITIQSHARGYQVRSRFKYGVLFSLDMANHTASLSQPPSADPLKALLQSNMRLLDRYFAYAEDKLGKEESAETTSLVTVPSPPWLRRLDQDGRGFFTEEGKSRALEQVCLCTTCAPCPPCVMRARRTGRYPPHLSAVPNQPTHPRSTYPLSACIQCACTLTRPTLVHLRAGARGRSEADEGEAPEAARTC